MPGGEGRCVWWCINWLEHGIRICKHSATLEEPELHDAVTSAMTALLDRKAELVGEDRANTGYGSRVQAITDTLEGTDSTISGFDDGLEYQMVSSIRVLNKERLFIRFKDGTELEQEIISRRASA